jgi:transcriptional antiterminator Rof (Rho-off)
VIGTSVELACQVHRMVILKLMDTSIMETLDTGESGASPSFSQILNRTL